MILRRNGGRTTMSNHPIHLRKLGLLLPLLALVGGLGAAASCGGSGDQKTGDNDGPNQPLRCDMPRPGCPCNDEGIKVV
ncbi:MAG: hypothetical protein DRI90_00645, partial [Deltaproteobacteria bacterium]